VGVVVEAEVREQSKDIEVSVKFFDFDTNDYLVVFFWAAKAVPEIGEAKFTGAVRQRGIKQQPEGMHQVALADLVFANHNDIPVDGYV